MLACPSVWHLSARTLVSQHRVPKSGLWKGFSGAPTAARAAVGHLAGVGRFQHRALVGLGHQGGVAGEEALGKGGGLGLPGGLAPL